jgi:hypothetical protein
LGGDRSQDPRPCPYQDDRGEAETIHREVTIKLKASVGLPEKSEGVSHRGKSSLGKAVAEARGLRRV